MSWLAVVLVLAWCLLDGGRRRMEDGSSSSYTFSMALEAPSSSKTVSPRASSMKRERAPTQPCCHSLTSQPDCHVGTMLLPSFHRSIEAPQSQSRSTWKHPDLPRAQDAEIERKNRAHVSSIRIAELTLSFPNIRAPQLLLPTASQPSSLREYARCFSTPRLRSSTR